MYAQTDAMTNAVIDKEGDGVVAGICSRRGGKLVTGDH